MGSPSSFFLLLFSLYYFLLLEPDKDKDKGRASGRVALKSLRQCGRSEEKEKDKWLYCISVNNAAQTKRGDFPLYASSMMRNNKEWSLGESGFISSFSLSIILHGLLFKPRGGAATASNAVTAAKGIWEGKSHYSNTTYPRRRRSLAAAAAGKDDATCCSDSGRGENPMFNLDK